MKYKIGQKVIIRSLEWYNKYKDGYEDIRLKDTCFRKTMALKFCGKVMTISAFDDYKDGYRMLEDKGEFFWTDEMIEGLVEDENNHLAEVVVDAVRESNDRYRIVVDPRFDIEVDEGEYYVVRRKKEYPKTYEECCKVLGYGDIETYCIFHNGADEGLFEALYRLKVCRDAYWKIAGEEMGLGKSWGPDWTIESSKYTILFKEIKIEKHVTCKYSRVLAFPTEEMRDTFYENFKELIEQCKELL